MVPQSSACLDWRKEKETQIAIHDDHSGIAKLSNAIGSAYYKVEQGIEKLLGAAAELMRSRREAATALQNTLSLLFMLQYEYFWFNVWCSDRSGDPPCRRPLAAGSDDKIDPLTLSKLSHRHPAYPVVSNIGLIMEILSALLQKYHLQMSIQGVLIGGGSTDFGERAPSSHTRPPTSLPQSPRHSSHDDGDLNADRRHCEHTYDVGNWSNSDREQLRYLISKFRYENDRLSHHSRHATSLDLIASSRLLKRYAGNSTELRDIEQISKIESLHSSLSKRASLKKHFQDARPEDEGLASMYPIGWIQMKPGTGSSNYRIVTSFDEKSTSVSTGEISSASEIARVSSAYHTQTQLGTTNQNGCWWNGGRTKWRRTSERNARRKRKPCSWPATSALPTSRRCSRP